jgi:hypothetical protein
MTCRTAWTIGLTASLFLVAAAAEAGVVALIDVNGAQGVPPAPDGNGNYWNAVTSVPSTVSLVDTSNASTGWSVALSQVGSGGGSGLSGGLNNTIAAPAPYDVQEAYADGWYDNTPGGLNGRFTFSGLNSANVYHLTLWGARGSNWNDGTVNVTAGTPTGASVLYQNTGLTLDVRPNVSNQIAFTFDEISSGGAGGTNAVLSLMGLEDGGVAPPPPPAFGAGEMLIDFGKLGQETTTYDGKTWNNVADAPGSITSPGYLLTDAVTTGGAATSLDLYVVNPPSNGFGIGGSNTNNDATGLGYPYSASRDQMYITAGFGPVNFELRDLNPGAFYNLTMFGTIDGTRTGSWTVGGVTKTLDLGGNTTEQVVFKGIAPDANGRIAIGYDGLVGSGVWSVLAIQAVPEPGALVVWSLLGGLGIGWGCWRRR